MRQGGGVYRGGSRFIVLGHISLLHTELHLDHLGDDQKL